MKITAVLMVESIERALSFWVDRMGFKKTVEVPEGDSLGFVILANEDAELMLQSFQSIRKDAPQFVPEGQSPGVALFVEVNDFPGTRKRLEGYPIALTERVTFYGMREIGVRDPEGHIVIFAAREAA